MNSPNYVLDKMMKAKYFAVRIFMPFLIDSFWRLFPRNKKTLLIIKNDGIGDYLLFRNFLQTLKYSSRFSDYKFYILTNPGTKLIASRLDSDVVDGFFFYSDDFFMKWELVSLLMRLQQLRPETIIYPNFSRKLSMDWIVAKIRAKHKIGVDGDLINETSDQKKWGDQYYSELISIGYLPMHEFERNKFLVDAITNETSDVTAPFIEKEKLAIEHHNGMVIFTSASNSAKTWPPRYFNAFLKRISKNSPIKIFLIPGKEENENLSELTAGLPENRVIVLPGLNIVELCEFIGGSCLVLSGDTVAVHIATALSIPVVCIAKGDLYGRFIPYPKYISNNIYCVFPPSIRENKSGYDQYTASKLDQVTPDLVYDTVEKVLETTVIRN